jgi:pyruvate kinase
MDTTKKAPNVPIADFKRTKILVTIGPATNSYESILALIEAGANGIRLNFSHGTNDERVQQIKWVRKAAKEYGKPIAIVQDLHGPKMQLGEFNGVFPVQKGQQIQLKYNADFERSGMLPTKLDFSKKVKRGERLLISDGKVKTTVTSVKDGIVYVRADNDGVLIKNKGVNLPDTDFGGDVIPQKDKDDVAFGSSLDIDYVAQSFIQSAADVRAMKRILKNLNSPAKLIAKIETQAALEDIENIIEEADVVMVARGDLAVEASLEVVPIQQRLIVGLCRRASKPVIIATQMLASMTESSEPSRAEVSDVATAVIIGTDAVMLSEETAVGRYPVETVAIMKKIVKYTEQNSTLNNASNLPDTTTATKRQESISQAVVSLAESVNATAIVAETKSGATAVHLAAKRPTDPLIAVTSDPRVANQLALVYGVKSYVRPDSKLAATKLTNWLERNRVLKKGDIIVTASGQYPGVVGTTDTIKLRAL